MSPTPDTAIPAAPAVTPGSDPPRVTSGAGSRFAGMRASLGRLVTLIVKELLSYVRDPRMRTILIGPPLAQLLVFSFAATLEVSNIDIAVLDEDAGTAGTELLEAIAASSFVGDIRLVHRASELDALIDAGEVLIGVRVPADFSRNVLSGATATAQVLLDGRRANAAQTAFGYLSSVAAEVGIRFDTVAGEGASRRSAIEVRHWFNPTLEYRWFIVPGLSGVLALLISLLVTALSIARERELGTFDQLLVSPVSPLEIIIGKSVPALLIGATLGTLMILAAVFGFGVPFTGSAWSLAAIVPLFILSGVGIGLSVSAVCRTQQQAILGAFALVVPIVLTSGFATPVSNMPPWLQTVSLANPLRHYLVIVHGSFLKAPPVSDIVASAWPLVVIAAVTLGFATWVVRGRLE